LRLNECRFEVQLANPPPHSSQNESREIYRYRT
jgi:hypothetical protein